jgi:hypothetical protein
MAVDGCWLLDWAAMQLCQSADVQKDPETSWLIDKRGMSTVIAVGSTNHFRNPFPWISLIFRKQMVCKCLLCFLCLFVPVLFTGDLPRVATREKSWVVPFVKCWRNGIWNSLETRFEFWMDLNGFELFKRPLSSSQQLSMNLSDFSPARAR